jgi:hypothetical protein
MMGRKRRVLWLARTAALVAQDLAGARVCWQTLRLRRRARGENRGVALPANKQPGRERRR